MTFAQEPNHNNLEKLLGSNGTVGNCIKIMFVILIFITFTQFDIYLHKNKINYLLIIVPFLILISLILQFLLYKKIVLVPQTIQVFVWAFMLLPWVLIAYDSTSLANYIMLFGSLISAGLLAALSLALPATTVWALQVFIWFSALSLLFQVIFNTFTNEQIDIHNFLFPFSRVSEISAADGFGFLRFNGFHLEPGSYAANVGIATILCIGVAKKIPKWTVLIVILTIIETRTGSGILYCFSIILICIYYHIRHSIMSAILIWPAIAISIVVFLVTSGFYSYLDNRFLSKNVQEITRVDGSSRLKVENFSFLVSAPTERQILGSGFMKIDCSYCSFVNSNGAGFAIIFFFGLMGCIMIAWLLRIGVSRSLVGFVLVVTLVFSRFTLVQPSFWVPILFLLAHVSFGKFVGKRNEIVARNH